MALQQIVQETVTGLGYDLVEIDRTAGGLLRITIDFPWQPGSELFINVEDCEKVTRQLLFALEVEAIEFKRLEVSSPGIDRLLRNANDFKRFAGEIIDITLRQPVGEAAQGLVNANRKKFRGLLQATELEQEWEIVWHDEPKVPHAKPNRKLAAGQISKSKKKEIIDQVLRFNLNELRDARLAPIVDFKGRRSAPGSSDGLSDADAAFDAKAIEAYLVKDPHTMALNLARARQGAQA